MNAKCPKCGTLHSNLNFDVVYCCHICNNSFNLVNPNEKKPTLKSKILNILFVITISPILLFGWYSVGTMWLWPNLVAYFTASNFHLIECTFFVFMAIIYLGLPFSFVHTILKGVTTKKYNSFFFFFIN